MDTIYNAPQFFTLNNGITIPSIGFGTYKLDDTVTVDRAIAAALDAGYRSFDCASYYGNQGLIGATLKSSGINRSELFLSSKVWVSEMGHDSTIQSFENSLKELKTDFLDLYMIHWPATASQTPDWKKVNASTWLAMEELLHQGRVRTIGVCNFKASHLEALLDKANVIPAINQIEHHPGDNQAQTVEYCDRHEIRVEAWSPLARGRIMENPTLAEIAERHGRSIAQICLRWSLQKGIVPLPKSENPERIKSNIDIFDFSLSESEMKAIDALDGLDNSGLDPDTVQF